MKRHTLVTRAYLGLAVVVALLAVLALPTAQAQDAPNATCTATASGSWNIPGTWDCNRLLTSTDDAVIPTGKTVTVGGTASINNVTINSGGTLNSNNYALSIFGNLSNSGTVSMITGTVNFAGTSAQTISGTSTFYNLTIANSGGSTVTLLANQTVGAALSITSGTFVLGTYTANGSSGGNFSVGAGAGISIGGTNGIPTGYTTRSLNATSTVTLNGTANSLTALSTAYGNLVIASGTTTLSSGFPVNGDVTINSGATLDVSASNYALTLYGDFTNNGTFNARNGVVTFRGTGAQTISGNNSLFNTLIIYSGSTTHLGATQTITSDLYISGTLNLNSYDASRVSGGGTLSLASGASLLIGGTNTVPGNYGTRTFAVDSTTVYSGTAQNIRNSTYLAHGNVILAGGTKSLAGATTIAGNLTINSGATLDATASNYALNVAGNFSNSGTFTQRNGTVTFNGTGAQTLTGATTFYNLTINNTAAVPGDGTAVTTDSAITVTNWMDVTDGQFSPATGSSLGGVRIAASGILKPAAGANINAPYDWSNLGTFTHNSGTVTFNGTGAKTIYDANTFNNLTISKTSGGSVTLAANQSIDTNLDITSGTFDLGSYTADRSTYGGSFNLRSGATLIIGATYPNNYNPRTYAADSTTIFNGTTQTVAGLTGYGNLTLSGGVKTLNGNGSVQGDLTISSGATLDVSASNYGLYVYGDFINSGTFNARSGVITFAGTGAQTISGNNALFNTLIINSTSTTHLAASQTITNDVYISGTLNMNSNGLNRASSGGKVSLASNATLLIGSGYPTIFTTFTFDPTSTTVYSGTTQSVLHGTYGNLTLSGGVKTIINPVTIAGDLTIASGATFDVSANNYALTVKGDFSNSGTFSARSGTVTFNGTATQTLTGATTFYNLTANNSAGITTTNNLTVSNALALTSDLNTGANVLNLVTNSVSGAGEVVGTVRRSSPATGSAWLFNNLATTFNFATAPTVLDVKLIRAAHPNANASGGGALMLPRYYTLTPTGAVNATVCLGYKDSELGAITEANLRLCRWTGSTWTCPTRSAGSSTATNTVCAAGVTQFSDWTLGAVGPTAVTLKGLTAAVTDESMSLLLFVGVLAVSVLGLSLAWAIGLDAAMIIRPRSRHDPRHDR